MGSGTFTGIRPWVWPMWHVPSLVRNVQRHIRRGQTLARFANSPENMSGTRMKRHIGLKKFKWTSVTITSSAKRNGSTNVFNGRQTCTSAKTAVVVLFKKCQLDPWKNHIQERDFHTCEYSLNKRSGMFTKVKHNCAQKNKKLKRMQIQCWCYKIMALHPTGKPQEFTVVQIEVPLETLRNRGGQGKYWECRTTKIIKCPIIRLNDNQF